MHAVKPPKNFFEISKRHAAAFRKAEEANREAQKSRAPFDLSKIKWVDEQRDENQSD